MIREFAFIDVYYLVLAARWTLALTALAFLGGGIVGSVVALLRVSPWWPLRVLGAGYVAIVQGTPLLAWLFVFFFGLPIVAASGLALDRRNGRLFDLCRRLPGRDLARLPAVAIPRTAVGGRQPRSASASSSSCAT